MSKTRPGVGVLGCGYWGKNLVRNFATLGVLAGVCDSDANAISKLRAQYPDITTYVTMSELLCSNDVTGVVIATPAEKHGLQVREALLAGKHVFVEKPLALDEGEARDMVRLAAQQERVLMVGHLLSYHAAFTRLKELVSGGELGRINYICCHRLNLGKIRREENILWSFAPHDVAMLLALAGNDPVSVVAVGGNFLHQRIADVTTTHLEFACGLKAHIFVSWLHPYKEHKLIVVGEKKMAVFDDTKPWPDKLLLYPHEIKWENNAPISAKAEPFRLDLPESEPLAIECAHFLDCIEHGNRPLTDGEEGVRVLRILKASQRSMDSGGKRVHLEPTGAGTASAQDIFVHETAVVDAGVRIGAGSNIWHFSHLLSGTVLGERVNVGQNVAIGPDVSIGNGCKIQNNVSIYKGVVLEDDVFCGPSMVFTNVFNPRAHVARMEELRSTRVGQGATLGGNCTIVCGNTIGRYAFVGAGAVVTRDVPAHALVMGNPARLCGWMCACGVKLGQDWSCPECGERYAPFVDVTE